MLSHIDNKQTDYLKSLVAVDFKDISHAPFNIEYY